MDIEQESKTFGALAYKAIAKHCHKFTQYESKVLKDRDPHYLHQMRVEMRRLRSTITGFAPAFDLPDNVTSVNIGKIARILGTLRDIDVLQATLVNQYQPYISDRETKSFQIVLKQLKKKRKSAFKKVVKTLKGKHYANLKKSCQSWLENPIYHSIAAIDVQHILPDLLLPQISYFLLHPGWLIGVAITEGTFQFANYDQISLASNISLTQEKMLHDLRKVAKKTRYNMELFPAFYGENFQEYLQEVKDIQEILGIIQDCFVLEDFLQNIIEQNDLKAMPTLSKMLQENRQQQWQKWQTKQKLFLDDSYKQGLRTAIEKPL